MSDFPTPWRVSQDECDVIDANDSKVMYWIPEGGYELDIDLDDLVSRINAGAEAEAWKKEATIVFEKISLHEVGEALNVPLGGCISSAILPGIKELEARAERAEKALEQAIELCDIHAEEQQESGGDSLTCMVVAKGGRCQSPFRMALYAYLKEKEKK